MFAVGYLCGGYHRSEKRLVVCIWLGLYLKKGIGITMKIKMIQYNVKTAKQWRINAADFHDARHALNDYVNERKDKIARIKANIATDVADLEKILLGQTQGVLRSKEDIETDKKLQEKYLKAEEDAMDDARKVADEKAKKLLDTVPESLYKAFVTSIESGNDVKFNEAFAKYLVDAGFDTATADNVPTLRFGIGKESTKGSAETGNLTKVIKFNPWKELFCRTLVDVLVAQKVIDPYKYAYKPEKRQKKSK